MVTSSSWCSGSTTGPPTRSDALGQIGLLLIAERAALLSGRDDEMGFTGMRWSELVDLEAQYVWSADVRVEWELYELDNIQLHR